MDKGKVKVLAIIIAITAIISLLTYLYLKNKNKDYVINTDIVETSNTDFFKVQNIILKYYDSMLTADDEAMGITNSFVAEKMYNNDDKLVKYFFVSGYLIKRNFDGDTTYNKGINYLVITKDNRYTIKPLDENINILEYAKSYEIVDVDLSNEKVIPSYYLTEDNKLSFYIASFIDLLVADSEKAYNMLSNDSKAKYGSYEEFKSKIFEIISNLSSKVLKYSKEGEKEVTYSIVDGNYNRINIIEESPMNFKISIN